MTRENWFEADVGVDFEESVRVDREGADVDHRMQSIDTYHVTEESGKFIQDFLSRLLGRSEDMRTGANYWLYGYYGSGKSHLLTVLDGLLDTDWVQNRRDDIWQALTDGHDLSGIEEEWETVHEDYHVIPISVNLLKYQGQQELSFSEIILRTAHESAALTGVAGGLSPRLDVAYFEDWYRTTTGWNERAERARDVLRGVVDSPSSYDWEDVQEYGALARVVLPELFAEQTGTEDGLDDLMPSDIDPEAMVNRLDELRAAREADLDEPVKLVLLLDEVSLFIGTDFDRLTELQTLAENVDEIGDGDIQLVATAQAKIEDELPQFAARGADFSIVKDRFPHRYGLPSRHVGEISTQRLLKKTTPGRKEVQELLVDATIDPGTSLVYSGIEQNTEPPIDEIRPGRMEDFYPFLPYQPSLFLMILSSLRQDAPDPAKSIFSGTARAILALVHGLLQGWLEEDAADHVISLVDFYDLIEPELLDITPGDVEVVEEIDEKHEAGQLEEIDVAVAKAVLLLQHVSDIIPMSERNIAVAMMDDLNGSTQFQMEDRVDTSLDRLKKYIRPTHNESGPRYTFAGPEEREIYEEAEKNAATPDWEGILEAMDEFLWEDIVRELSLPGAVEYGDTGEQYPVRYTFSVDGQAFDTTIEAEGALDVSVAIQGLNPDDPAGEIEGNPLEWTIDTDGLTDLRDHLEEWWALRKAVGGHSPPRSVGTDLSERSTRVRSKLVEALRKGTFEVADRVDLGGLNAAVRESVDVRYPGYFHPVMLQVGDEHLRELRNLTAEDPLPEWAENIQVATEQAETHGGTIQNKVRALVGQRLRGHDGSMSLQTLLDRGIEDEPIYDGTRPALCAIIWGLCRKGDFRPVDESGDSLELDTVLDLDSLTTTRLKIANVGENPREILENGGFLETTEGVPDGLVNLQEANRRLADRIASLAEDVQLVASSDANSETIQELLHSFVDELNEQEEAALERRSNVRDTDASLKEIVDSTNAAADWYDDVNEVWTLRLPALMQLDSLLTITQQSYGWLTADCDAATSELRESLADYSAGWWTHDGWDSFNDARDVTPALDDAVEAAWADFQASTGIKDFVGELDEQPWVRPANELTSETRPAFERTYITPLWRAKSWHADLDEALDTILGEATTTDADQFVRASDVLLETEPLEARTRLGYEELETRYEELTSIVGDRTPDEVTAIGVIPPDRESLEREIEQLVEQHELSIETTGAGVVLR